MGGRLIVDHGRVQEELPLSPGAHVVGRDPGVAVRLVDELVSWRHAVIVVAGDVVQLHDLGGINGVSVNGRELDRLEQVPLRDGDRILVGCTTLLYRADVAPPPARPRIVLTAPPAPVVLTAPPPLQLVDSPAPAPLQLAIVARRLAEPGITGTQVELSDQGRGWAQGLLWGVVAMALLLILALAALERRSELVAPSDPAPPAPAPVDRAPPPPLAPEPEPAAPPPALAPTPPPPTTVTEPPRAESVAPAPVASRDPIARTPILPPAEPPAPDLARRAAREAALARLLGELPPPELASLLGLEREALVARCLERDELYARAWALELEHQGLADQPGPGWDALPGALRRGERSLADALRALVLSPAWARRHLGGVETARALFEDVLSGPGCRIAPSRDWWAAQRACEGEAVELFGSKAHHARDVLHLALARPRSTTRSWPARPVARSDASRP